LAERIYAAECQHRRPGRTSPSGTVISGQPMLAVDVEGRRLSWPEWLVTCTSMTSTRSKVIVKVTELLTFRKLHFSRSISSVFLAWSSKLMVGSDSTGPDLQLVNNIIITIIIVPCLELLSSLSSRWQSVRNDSTRNFTSTDQLQIQHLHSASPR